MRCVEEKSCVSLLRQRNLSPQLCDTLIGADKADGYSHVLELLPRSSEIAAALALGLRPCAGLDVLKHPPAREIL